MSLYPSIEELIGDLQMIANEQSNPETRLQMLGTLVDIIARHRQLIEVARREGYAQCQIDQRNHLLKLHGG